MGRAAAAAQRLANGGLSYGDPENRVGNEVGASTVRWLTNPPEVGCFKHLSWSPRDMELIRQLNQQFVRI